VVSNPGEIKEVKSWTRFPLVPICLIICIFIVVIAFNLMRGGKGAASIIGIEK
jgi:hypothetical protein